jgi:hypothetical protein
LKKIFPALILSLFLVSCNKSPDDGATDCTSSVQAEDGSTTTTDCTINEPITGDTTGGTSGGTTGSSTGGTSTGGTTGSSTGGSTTGGTTGSSTTGGTTGGTTGSTTGGSSTGGTTGGTGSLPNEAYTFDSNISFFNTTATQEAKFNKALEIIKQVVATEEFRSRILNFTYGGKKTFVDNGGFTNAQIYQKILDAAETLQNTKDNEMDMEVEIYTASTSTVGYTYANSKRIWVNTKFFNSYDATGVARNLFHEWLHKLGFSHASSYSTSRDSSVPYAIGSIIGDIGKDYL